MYNDNFFCRSFKRLDEKIKLGRLVIPTKDNPPPEMSDWLIQFQVKLLFQDNRFTQYQKFDSYMALFFLTRKDISVLKLLTSYNWINPNHTLENK